MMLIVAALFTNKRQDGITRSSANAEKTRDALC